MPPPTSHTLYGNGKALSHMAAKAVKVTDAFIPPSTTIFLGKIPVEVRECPLARVKRFQRMWSETFSKIQEIRATVTEARANDEELDPDKLWESAVDLAFDKPYEILSVLVPNCPKEPFDDEDDGVTIPQLIVAFDEVLELNRLEWLKKLTPFFRDLILTIDPSRIGRASLQRTESLQE